MGLDGLQVSNLVISKSSSLLKVFDHLFDLPAFGVIFDDIQGGKKEIRGDKITGLLSFLFYCYHSHFAQALDRSGQTWRS